MTLGNRMPALQRPMFLALLTISLLVATAQTAAAESYKPIFSDEFLQQADPATRARLTALNEENRRKWLANKTSPAPGTAKSAKAPNKANASGKPKPNKPQSVQSEPRGAKGSLYRYRDSAGKVRYSDTWVEGASVVRVDTGKPTQASRQAHEDAQREQAKVLEYFDLKNEKRKEKRQAKAAAAKARREQDARCHEIWIELRDDKRGGFLVYELDENGERYFLNDDEIAARIARREADYIEQCGELPEDAE